MRDKDKEKGIVVAPPRPGGQGALGPVVIPQATLDGIADALWSARAPATWRAYRLAWNDWQRWCAGHNACPLPAAAEAVAAYLVEESAAGAALATLNLRVTAISQVHRKAKLPSPTRDERVREVLRGLKRSGKRARPKSATTAAELGAMLATIDKRTLAGKRDRAMLLVGFASAMRRSELVGITVESLAPNAGGLVAHLDRSKTDQEGEGREVAIARVGGPACPVGALRDWLRAAGIGSGPVFRGLTPDGRRVREGALSDSMVARLVKRCAAAAGLDARRFAGHSLRSGHVTEAYLRGVAEAEIQAQTGHHSLPMLRRYRRIPDAVRSQSSRHLGLGPQPPPKRRH